VSQVGSDLRLDEVAIEQVSYTNLAQGDWANVTTPVPQIVGGQWQVTLPVAASTTSTFYRLVK
jgi:hypothetical protein